MQPVRGNMPHVQGLRVNSGVRCFGVIALALALAGCEAAHSLPLPQPAVDGYSNIYAADYVGPAACGKCHSKRYRQWRANLHHAMNRRPSDATVVAAFDGRRVRYAGGEMRPLRKGDIFVMELRSAAGKTRAFRVTRTIGRRYLQEYVGVEIGGAATEVRLPFGFVVARGRWFHQQYFDSWYGAEYDAAGQPKLAAYTVDASPWNRRCIWCHNTYPFELRGLRGSGANPLGNGRERFFRVLRQRRDAEFVAQLRGHNTLPQTELITVGISCESCHLGGREHAVNDRPISFVPRSPDLLAKPNAPSLAGGRHNPAVVNSICAGCHSTPSDRFPNGGVTRNSSEALDLFAGACVSKIKCTHCHDPHVKGPGAGAPVQPKHVAACLGCHTRLKTEAARVAHSRHDAATASCLDCHMPKMVQGVSAFVRAHRISSPSNRAMLRAGAPNACNLCHLDRSVRWTLNQLARGWGVRIRPTRAWRSAYAGDLTRPVGEIWLASKNPRYMAAAAAAYGRSRLSSVGLRAILQRLDHPVAYYRMWLVAAVEASLGRKLSRDEYDPAAAPARRASQVRRLLERERSNAL